ncbi:DUF2461 domain-containing protein [Sneathiella sp.]|jgi:uncharacterized protein (TIGR02453 family)|uniref:DUF2461 domain-containing protein n=1 Tax=Sneathiella sp. TaxID=1964365 RepID=UPI0039E37742
MSQNFNGFSEDFQAFFKELKENNNRDWFAANKKRYQDIVQYPISDFVADLGPKLEEIAPCYVADPRPNRGSMFRIYRDIRFSKDQRPYKDHAACQFRHQAGKNAHAPGFYIHLADDGVHYGGGIWMPPSPKLALIRQAIDKNQDKWLSITQDETFLKTFGALNSEGALKRPPKGFSEDHPLIDDLKKKSFFAMHRAPAANLQKASLLDDVIETYEKAVPLMRFLTNAVGLPF